MFQGSEKQRPQRKYMIKCLACSCQRLNQDACIQRITKTGRITRFCIAIFVSFTENLADRILSILFTIYNLLETVG